jgi:hypothetical protein
MDFTPGTDRLDLRGLGIAGFAALTLIDGPDAAFIPVGATEGIVLLGVDAAALLARDVLF